MADSKPAGRGDDPGNEQNEFGRPGQRKILQGLEGLLKNLPLTEMSDAVARSSRLGRARLDSFLLRRERDQLFRELGRTIADEARAGQLKLPVSALDVWNRLLGVEARLEEELRDLARSQATSTEGQPSEPVGSVSEPAAATQAASDENEANGAGKTIGRRKPRPSNTAGKTATQSKAAKPSKTATASSTEGKKEGGSRTKAASTRKTAGTGKTASKAATAKRSTATRKPATKSASTSAKGAKSKAATAKSGEKEVKKTVGRRAPRKKAAPKDTDGSSQ